MANAWKQVEYIQGDPVRARRGITDDQVERLPSLKHPEDRAADRAVSICPARIEWKSHSSKGAQSNKCYQEYNSRSFCLIATETLSRLGQGFPCPTPTTVTDTELLGFVKHS